MRILTRYILGEITSHSLIGCALFTFILFMKDLGPILDAVVRNSSSFNTVMQIFLFTLPNTFLVTIPMAVLVGVLLGLSRLSADSEITAMRASGLGIWYFVRVASIVALLGTGFGLFNSLYVIPRANRAILEMRQQLATSQASFEIQPRVFYEDFKNAVIYVQNVLPGTGASNWQRLFLADVSDPAAPKITTAETATVVQDNEAIGGPNGGQGLLIRLRNGSEHEMVANQPGQYNISTFTTIDRPLTFSPQSDVHLGRMDTPLFALSNRDLMELAKGPDGQHYKIELHRRLAFPVACLVLMLIGVPLGTISRRGGKSSGFIFTILLVLVYYLLSNFGIAWAKQGRLPAVVGVWLANVVFAAAGLFLLSQMASGGKVISYLSGLFARKQTAEVDPVSAAAEAEEDRDWQAALRARWKRRFGPHLPRPFAHFKRRGFPLILDEYVLKEFLKIFGMVLAGFVLLLLVFTFFELMGDILRNHVSLMTVGAYLLNLTPSMLYQITPLSVLIAVLVTFGMLNRSSELIAMKATGISLYRLVIPVLVISVILAAGLFAFDQFYLPQANRKQEALRNIIKGRPAQTTLHPDQKWILGQQPEGAKHATEPGRIFYYQFFSPDENAFANLTLFEFDPATFAVTKRVFASRVVWDEARHAWVFENGWERTMQGDTLSSFREFQNASFPEMREEPGYFKKENLQSQEMNFGQLRHYISDLQQSGFDTMRLRVQLYDKLAYPLVTIVMAVLAIPFALSMGRRSSLTGVAMAIGIALSYWAVSGLFDAMGNVNFLPSAIAAWSPDILFGLTGGYLLLRTPT